MAEPANQQVAALLEQMGNLKEVLGEDSYRVVAYQRASRAIAELGEPVANLYDPDNPDEISGLTALNGVGKKMAQRIVEYLRTGTIAEYDALLEEVPAGILGLLEVPGLGPRTVAALWREAGVDSKEVLKDKLDNDLASLTAIKGLGKKTLENVRKNLAFAEEASRRFRIGPAMDLAAWFLDALRSTDGVEAAEYAGSLRRGKETVGDLDLLVATSGNEGERIGKALTELEPVTEVIQHGATKTSVRTELGMQVDLRVLAPESFGAAEMYFTGSKEHNVRMRERAIARGMKLSEYGLDHGDERIAGASEEAVFSALGLHWIPPELREDRGEIEQAEHSDFSDLLVRDQIGAELHAHTDASDGKWTIEAFAETAAARGYHTIAVTDHSASQAIANGLSAERLEKHVEAIRDAAERYAGTIRILAGSEVDILADGRLDYPESLLEQLDVVVASPHTALKQEPADATKRLLTALESPSVTILGHPTGRLVNSREGINPDMGAVIAAAKERDVALEINANHRRLDLRDAHARQALEAGVKLAINTDAHGAGDLDELVFGVLTARRAGATPDRIVNCMSPDALAGWLAGRGAASGSSSAGARKKRGAAAAEGGKASTSKKTSSGARKKTRKRS